ncbi:hypothetical protein [Chryseobacterium binzhouense]|uniref:hypothetical protein n=1 Tax=Chryseobacterium binzhouense TaxID=2593646 RepID=UPI00117F62DE|nr:hypothetical protein [Chryseobacterium binzhouense]
MEIFLNESSLDSQYKNEYEFAEAIRFFVSSISRISKHSETQRKTFNSDYLFYRIGFSDTMLGSMLKKNHAINSLFIQNLNLISPKIWQKEQQHDSDILYEYNDIPYQGFSPAELAERKLQNNDLKGFLLNFVNSEFKDFDNIKVIKNKVDTIEIDCVVYESNVEDWLIKNGFYNPDDQYDIKSGIAPRDSQTILKNEKVFVKTNHKRNKGRVVYKKIGTNQLWVVDGSSKHAGVKAHIEVFDENTRKHLGTSLYFEDSLNTNFKVDNREIFLE